ncbi:MAG: NAD-dependent epimerase/dehydratase family protein [Caldilineaceae bacterium]
MRYFITGATGFVGGRVAQMLVNDGHQVVAVVRTPAKATDLTKLGIEIHQGDVIDKASMRAPMTGVDGVFHIAGWYKIGAKDKSDGVKVNIEGTRNVLELMQELKIAKGVYTSTLAVNSDTHGREVNEKYHFDGRHLTEYDRTKAEAHKIADAFIANGLPLVILMPGMIYGPGDTSSARTTFVEYLQRKLPMIPQQTAFSAAHVDDIARAHITAMEKAKPGETYIVAGPTHTLVDILHTAEEITGIPTPRSAPPWVFSALSSVMGVAERFTELPETYRSEYLRVAAGTTYIGDASKAKRELGYNPRSLKEGLTETLQHEMRLLGIPLSR